MNTVAMNLALACGVAVGNVMIYRFLWGKDWTDAIGIGVTAGLITLALMWLISFWR